MQIYYFGFFSFNIPYFIKITDPECTYVKLTDPEHTYPGMSSYHTYIHENRTSRARDLSRSLILDTETPELLL